MTRVPAGIFTSGGSPDRGDLAGLDEDGAACDLALADGQEPRAADGEAVGRRGLARGGGREEEDADGGDESERASADHVMLQEKARG